MKRDQQTISCDICLDLMPLVHDGVASADSQAVVMAHIAGCSDCSEAFQQLSAYAGHDAAPNDKAVLSKIKKRLFFIALAFLGCGALIGISLTSTFGMFYNLIIMPFIGIGSYFILKSKWFFAPMSIFSVSYLWQFIKNIVDGALSEGSQLALFTVPLLFSSIYCVLAIVGVIIAALLHYAFRKEVNQ